MCIFNRGICYNKNLKRECICSRNAQNYKVIFRYFTPMVKLMELSSRRENFRNPVEGSQRFKKMKAYDQLDSGLDSEYPLHIKIWNPSHCFMLVWSCKTVNKKLKKFLVFNWWRHICKIDDWQRTNTTVVFKLFVLLSERRNLSQKQNYRTLFLHF